MRQIETRVEGFSIRKAEMEDVPVVLEFIKGLAEYEKLSNEVVATEENLKQYLFGEDRVAEVVLGYFHDIPVGFALYFYSFSTFLGKPGIYLEDLFVMDEYRGRGFGKAFLIYLAKLASDKGFGRLEWAVLDWNEPAIDFYKSIGARMMDEWIINRVSGKTLEELASGF